MGKNCPSAGFKNVLWQVKTCEGQWEMEKRNLLSQKGKCIDNLGYSFWLSKFQIFERILRGMFLRAEGYLAVYEIFLTKTIKFVNSL